MAIGTSLLLIAAGAILAWAVDYEVSGVDLQTIGGILVVVGIIGLIFSLLFLASFAPFGARETVDHGRRDGHDHM
jgi:hypothetical protein